MRQVFIPEFNRIGFEFEAEIILSDEMLSVLPKETLQALLETQIEKENYEAVPRLEAAIEKLNK